jgi:hypothetical protein
MRKLVVIIFSLLLSCNDYGRDNSSEHLYPSKDELKYKRGDCFAFKASDSTYGCVVVFDFSKDEGGIWYGTFFSSYDSPNMPTIADVRAGRVMGRKIASSLDKEGYTTCLDGEYIIDSLFLDKTKFNLIGNINLKNIDYGSRAAIANMTNLRMSFHQAKQDRLKEPDHYSQSLTKINDFHPEEYFEMKDFER